MLIATVPYVGKWLHLDPDPEPEPDPDPKLITDPDPDMQIISDPAGSGSGSTTLLRIRKFFFTDPDSTYLLAMVNKNNFLNHHITDKKSS